jgi:hypothetical protein
MLSNHIIGKFAFLAIALYKEMTAIPVNKVVVGRRIIGRKIEG